jgi:hypothetical protein
LHLPARTHLHAGPADPDLNLMGLSVTIAFGRLDPEHVVRGYFAPEPVQHIFRIRGDTEQRTAGSRRKAFESALAQVAILRDRFRDEAL